VSLTTRTLVIGVLIAASVPIAPASAQTFARRAVPAGDVTGLELQIDGQLTAVPGSTLRWFVTAHEVVRHQDLRAAPGAAVKVLASHDRSEPVAEAITDQYGRADLSFEVPSEASGPIHVIVEVRSRRGIMRSFDVTLNAASRQALEVFVDRSRVAPGDRVHAWGRVFDRSTSRPVANTEVTLDVSDRSGSQAWTRVTATTDLRGLFRATVPAPAFPTEYEVRARAGDADGRAAGLLTAEPSAPALIVQVRPDRAVAAPGTTLTVDVAVRTPDGRPVPRVTIDPLPTTPPLGEVETDSSGRARLSWTLPSIAAGSGLSTASATVHASRPGLGRGEATVRVRVARVPAALTWTVEGGALVPELRSRVYVRVSQPDGSPFRGQVVELRGTGVEGAQATTDTEGVAVLDTQVVPAATGAMDGCGGPTAARAELSVAGLVEELCLPVDPDATLRVRVSPLATIVGRPYDVEILRRPSVRASPVSVMALRRTAAGWVPVAHEVVGPALTRLALTLPPEATGEVWIRARPLVGATLSEVRGGGTLVHSSGAEVLSLSIADEGEGRLSLRTSGAGDAGSAGFLWVMPPSQGRAILDTLRQSMGELPMLLDVGAGRDRVAGELASRTPTDEAVPAVLRDGRILTLPLPSDPVAQGLLRDPWRTRARFVGGRVGRLIQTVEQILVERIPFSLDEVGVRTRSGWRFNAEVLSLAAPMVGPEGVQSLDGSPLSIEELASLDPAFTFDNMARRVTRERLMRLLVVLTRFVRAEGLDHDWARRGDPSTWLTALNEWEDPEGRDFLEYGDLFDGWGRPFALRRARGGRARFRFLEPVSGYELVSSGPDGRYGNADDVFDPFARVLPSGGMYARAVGEDALLARLTGVEIGRVTIQALAEIFGLEPPQFDYTATRVSTQTWGQEPAPLANPDDALDVRVRGRSWPVLGAFRDFGPAGGRVRSRLPAEPRQYVVVAGAYGADGRVAFASVPMSAGAPLLLDFAAPTRLLPRQEVSVPVDITWLGPPTTLTVEVRTEGNLIASLRGPRSFAIEPGQARPLTAILSARELGRATVHLTVVDAEGNVVANLRRSLHVTPPGILRAQHAGALVTGPTRLGVDVPDDAAPVRTTLHLTAPRQLVDDPGFSELWRARPALPAWSSTLAGRPLGSERLQALLSSAPGQGSPRRGSVGMLDAACALVVFAAQDADDASMELARRRASGALTSLVASSPAERGAVLVALAASAPGEGDANGSDPIGALVASLREEARLALWTERHNPGAMARAAAGLLIADRTDAAGRALFDRAREALRPGEHAGQVLPPSDDAPGGSWASTAALAIAARQLEQDDLAAELGRALLPRLHVALGDNADAAFWILAASAYGVFGMDGPATVTVEENGVRRTVNLASGSASVPLGPGDLALRIDGGRPVIARVEARYIRPAVDRGDTGIVVRLRGDVGRVGESAGLELVVVNRGSARVRRPVVEVMLPPQAAFRTETERALRRSRVVAGVEAPDARGLLRLRLRSLAPLEEQRIALPVRWQSPGTFDGFAVAAYDATRPWRVSTFAPRRVTVRGGSTERWTRSRRRQRRGNP